MSTDMRKFSLKKGDIIPRAGILSYANADGVVSTSTHGYTHDFLLLTMLWLDASSSCHDLHLMMDCGQMCEQKYPFCPELLFVRLYSDCNRNENGTGEL